MKRIGVAFAMILPLVLLAVSGLMFLHESSIARTPLHPAAHRRSSQGHQVAGHCPQIRTPLIGVAPSTPWRRRLAQFAQATGVHPQLAAKYIAFGSPFDSALAGDMASEGTVLLIQMLPRHQSLAAIAAGRYDTYLEKYADAVREFGCPVMFSFAHEMNGPWWPWGRGRQPAADWVAAYQHVYGVFAAARVTNVIWVWNPDRSYRATAWWPGPRYVDVVAFDGYYWLPRYTFADLYAHALYEAAHLAPGKPVMIAETGAYPGPRMPARVRNLMDGVKVGHLIGLVYFEHRGHHADWRLERNPAAIAAFRAGVRTLQRKPLQPLLQQTTN